MNRFRRISESFVPPSLHENAETLRKARLIVSFGFLGAAFGFSYALFYLCIGHWWGAGIISASSSAAVAVPFYLCWTGNVRTAGNMHTMILTLGFFGLATVEGGVHGHAVAWLAAVPLCALLLADHRSALAWCGICFFATGWFCVKDITGIQSRLSYTASLHPLVTAVGFMGFTAFMSLLGLIFEKGRERAYTKLADALAELSRTNEQLKRLYAEKDEFFGMAAHDIKNRIHIVRGLAELIMESPDLSRDQIRQDADEIIHASMKMQEELANLLALDAIEEGRFQLTVQVCDLAQIAARVVGYYRSTAARKQVAIQYTNPEAALAIVDPGAAMQAMDNLISNAIKYSPPGRTVYVEMGNTGGRCSFSVRDEGPGFTDEDKRRLFTKFARLSANPTGGESSTGLGLSIVKKFVEAMKGDIQCESAAGAGAKFVVTLPAVGETAVYEEAI